MKPGIFFIMVFLLISLGTWGQPLQLLNSAGKSNLRGISIHQKTIWVSGSQGTVGHSKDGGLHWIWQQVSGFEKSDFRDIEAIDDNTAIIMAIGSPGYLLRTEDGGKNWTPVYENHHPEVFMDAIIFKNRTEGVVIGDPIDQKVFYIHTQDAGKTWKTDSLLSWPKLSQGEAFFAASGSNGAYLGNALLLVTGGNKTQLLKAGKTIPLPLSQGASSTGANAVAVFKNNIMIVGGDFSRPGLADSTCAFSIDGGGSFITPDKGPLGYRSAVAALSEKIWISCGLTGVDISTDGGRNWQTISKESMNAIGIDRHSKKMYLVGEKNKVGLITF